ncbi:MAG: glutaredoxin family protein [Nevskia sp.]|nr:glutaredoxin family protein [Nevskia sp.]
MAALQTALSDDQAGHQSWQLLSRPGCHLCDEFSDQLLTAFPRLTALLEWIDVDSRDDWRERYGRSIPVLLDPQQQAVCETDFDRAAVAAALLRTGCAKPAP